MKEIGGYIELDTYHGKMLYENGIKLNSAKSCLSYLVKKKRFKKIVLPYYLCDSISDTLNKHGVEIDYYHINESFIPSISDCSDGEWLYLVNYYGQLDYDNLNRYSQEFPNIILDNVQAYFDDPPKCCSYGGMIHAIYSCRKFFGVPDGGIMYSDIEENKDLEKEVSYDRMRFLLGRYELPADVFYDGYKENNERIRNAPVLKMSRLTENLLHGIDYDYVRNKRTENYMRLYRRLKNINNLKLKEIEGAFSYPLYVDRGSEIRKRLISHKIYVPQLWPNVSRYPKDFVEHKFAVNILPLPCDQRYTVNDMDYIADKIIDMMK